LNCPNELEARSYVTQEMLDKGFLASNSLFLSTAHSKRSIENYLDALFEVFNRLAGHLQRGDLNKVLRYPAAQPGMGRLN